MKNELRATRCAFSLACVALALGTPLASAQSVPKGGLPPSEFKLAEPLVKDRQTTKKHVILKKTLGTTDITPDFTSVDAQPKKWPKLTTLPTAPAKLPTVKSRQTIQQPIPGEDAGKAVGLAIGWNKRRAEGADEALKLLASPNRANAQSAHQLLCDTILSDGQRAFDKWGKTVAGKPGIPETIDRFPAWHRETAGKPERGGARDVAKSLGEFMATCFSAAPAGFPGALSRAIGALARSNGVRFCSVLRTGITRVTTARHCVEKRDGSRMESDEVKQLHVQLPELGAGRFAVRGYAKITGLASISLENDWVVLEIEPAAAADLPKLVTVTQTVPAGTRVAIGGLILGPEPATDPDRPMYSSTLSCMVVYATPSCLVHTCNTFPGMSGAPIFVRLGGEWHFAAVHSRAALADDLSGECKPQGSLAGASKVNAGVFAASFLP